MCVLLLFLFCWTDIFRDFAHDGTSNTYYMIKANYFESKILPLESLYSPKKFASM